MSGWWDTINVEDGEEADYTIHQLVSYLKTSYKDRDYSMVEELLMKREAKIRNEMENREKGGKKNEELEIRLRNEVEELEAKHNEALLLKVIAEESLTKLEKQCEDLRGQTLKLIDGEKRAAEMCEGLHQKMMEVEKNGKERVKELELMVEIEKGLRKKADEDLQLSEMKFKELELMILKMQKDVDLLNSLGVRPQGKEMGDENNRTFEAEGETVAPSRVPNDQFSGGSVVPSVKTVEKKVTEGANPVSPVSTPNMKAIDPLDTDSDDLNSRRKKRTTEDGVPSGKLGKTRAKHGCGTYIVLSSDDDDDPSESQLRSNDKSDCGLIKLDLGSKFPSESGHEEPGPSLRIKQKHMSCINEDKTDTVLHLSVDERTSPHLSTQKGKEVQPCYESQPPPPSEDFGIRKSVNSGEPKERARGCVDNDQWKKALYDKLHKVWDEVSSGSSMED